MSIKMPVFLTEEDAIKVITTQVVPCFNALENKSRNDGYLILVVPEKISPANDFEFELKPKILLKYPLTPVIQWKDGIPFDKIALSKTMQLWYAQNTPGNMTSKAHLLFPGDTRLWGGYSDGLLCAGCSGIQPWYDQLLSKILIAGCIAEAENNYQIWLEQNPGKYFV